MRNQFDIFRHSATALAAAARVQSATAAGDPHWTPSEQRERQAYYLTEAERLEATVVFDKQVSK